MKLKNSRRKIEIAPEISKNHICSLKKKYNDVLKQNIENYILVMSYTSTGIFFLTGDSLHFDNFMQGGLKTIKFSDITKIRALEGKLFIPDKLCLSTENAEYILDGCIDGLNLNALVEVFNHIITKARSSDNDFTVSEQGVLSSQLPEDIKLLYLKVLCNYAYINDAVINPNEYNAITKFSIRMALQGETRSELRVYMNDYEGRIKTGNLLASIKKMTENQTGYWDVVKYCMMQDALYIHEIQSPGKSWRDDGFIGSLKDHCSLEENQVESMIKAVSLNKLMVKKDIDMDKVKEEWIKLVRAIKDTSGYVPTPYLFCSGSVYGLKSYDEFFKRDETSQKTINKQRELILQELITNNQKTMNVLIGDMNYLAERLERALENEDKIQHDYENIQQLLSRLKLAMSSIKPEEESEEEIPRSSED